MKKLLVVLLLGCGCHAIAQNVGIGTTTPSFKLDVRSGSINTDSVYRINYLPVLSTRGIGNTFVGDNAGRLTTGNGNTFVGDTAGVNNTTGHTNTGVGTFSLAGNTSGMFNTGVGNRSLIGNTTGAGNTAIGAFSMALNQTGNSNTAIGDGALQGNISGSYNFAGGTAAMVDNTIGAANTGIGYAVLGDNTTGNDNTAFGSLALAGNISGSFNTAIGSSANVSTGILINATAIGARSWVSSDNSLVLGSIAGVNSAPAYTKVGIGISNPSHPFHVVNPTDNAIAAFDGATGMYLALRETGLYRGYIGSFAGNASDVDFGTGAGNVTGRVHLTLQANPRFTLDATSTNIYDAELNRTLKTGNANLVPICYGNVSSTGFVQAGSGNFSVMHSAGSGFYEIAINDEEYQFQQYITVVTPIGTSGGAVVACTGSGADRLQVQLYTLAGADIDRNFHFVVYKP